MKYNPPIHNRKSIRLKNYRYDQSGEYFVTMCTYNREHLFGEIENEEMRLSSAGIIVQEEWLRTASMRREIELDAFVVMPNHVHGIIVIKDESPVNINISVGTHGRASLQRKPRSLSSLVAGFKSVTTKRINEMRNTPHSPVWQSRFYDHIIRSDKDLNNTRDYILNNPIKWCYDEENLFCIPK